METFLVKREHWLKRTGLGAASSGGLTMFAFVTRDGSDTLEEVVVPCCGCDTSLETLHCSPSVFGHRVVFGLFMGQFTVEEVNLFMIDLSDSPGSPPMAHEYFAIYVEDSLVNTGGISFQSNNCASVRVLEINYEYRCVKFIDELALMNIRVEWHGLLKSLQAIKLPSREP